MKTYVARFEKDGKSWHVFVPEVAGCRTHASNIEQGMERIREALSLFDEGKYDVVPDVDLGSLATQVVEDANRLREDRDSVNERCGNVQARAIRVLTKQKNLSDRDAGFLLGVSHQYIAKQRKARSL